MPNNHTGARAVNPFLVGGLGAVAPILLSLLTVDLGTIMSGASRMTLLGYAIRVCILFLVGGVYVWVFHSNEKARKRAFEFGVLAPALLTTAINGLQAKSTLPNASASTGFSLVGEAHAQTMVRSFRFVPVTSAKQFWYGLTGQRDVRTWYVIASSHATEAEARAQATALRARWPQFAPAVYRPSAGQTGFTVVIGERLTSEQAALLQSRAESAGLHGTFTWTPKPPAASR